MFKVKVTPHWEIRQHDGEALDTAVLLALLRSIEETGSIARAAQAVGLSYRYAWGLLRKAEALRLANDGKDAAKNRKEVVKAADAAARPRGAPDILEERPLSVVSGRPIEALSADAP